MHLKQVRHPRAAVDLSVVVFLEELPILCRTRDLSPGGLGLWSALPCQPEGPFQAKLHMPHLLAWMPMTVELVHQRQQDDGFVWGLRILDAGPQDMALLKDLVNRCLPKPATPSELPQWAANL